MCEDARETFRLVERKCLADFDTPLVVDEMELSKAISYICVISFIIEYGNKDDSYLQSGMQWLLETTVERLQFLLDGAISFQQACESA